MPTERSKRMRYIAALKREHPPAYPVTIRTVTRKDRTHGWTIFDGRQYWIYLRRDQTHSEWVDSLIHEYAHCLDGCENRDTDHASHGETWGVWYSRCYRTLDDVSAAFHTEGTDGTQMEK